VVFQFDFNCEIELCNVERIRALGKPTTGKSRAGPESTNFKGSGRTSGRIQIGFPKIGFSGIYSKGHQ